MSILHDHFNALPTHRGGSRLVGWACCVLEYFLQEPASCMECRELAGLREVLKRPTELGHSPCHMSHSTPAMLPIDVRWLPYCPKHWHEWSRDVAAVAFLVVVSLQDRTVKVLAQGPDCLAQWL